MVCRPFPALLFSLVSLTAQADVVKPALIEISVDVQGTYVVEIRASIEALLTGINARYRDTTESPMGEAYDELRVLPPDQLAAHFAAFKQTFADGMRLTLDGQPVPLTVTSYDIPEVGYPKVPRISVIRLAGELQRSVASLTLYYPARYGDCAMRVRQVDEGSERWHWSDWQWIRSDVPSAPFSLSEVFTERPVTRIIGTYLYSGYLHILPLGLDHILFIIGLYLLSIRLRPLLWQITAFTVAHTVTLGLSAAGYIELPARVVEPLIALSIAYVAIENVFVRGLHRHRVVIVFLFGLLHGLGFASVLLDFGLPEDAFLVALLSFNVGVELGQLTVIAAAFLLVGLWFRHRRWYRQRIVVPVSLLIAGFGLWWTWERFLL